MMPYYHNSVFIDLHITRRGRMDRPFLCRTVLTLRTLCRSLYRLLIFFFLLNEFSIR